jgi:predicted PurR-regulated permease PerM
MSDNRSSILSTTSKVNLVTLCILLFIAALITLTEYLNNIVCMVAAALICTYILLGPVNLLEKALLRLRLGVKSLPQPLARALAILLVYFSFFVILLISVFNVAPPLAEQMREFARELPTYVSRFTETRTVRVAPAHEPLAELVQESFRQGREVPATSERLPEKPESNLEKSEVSIIKTQKTVSTLKASNRSPLLNATYQLAIEQVIANYKKYASRLGGLVLDLGGATLSTLIYALTTLVLMFYLLHDGEVLKRGMVHLLPSQHEAGLEALLLRLHVQFHTIVKGQILMSLVSGSLVYVLLLVMGAKFALLLSVFFAITSLLPVIGPWIGLIPIVVLLAFSRHAMDILNVLLACGLFYIIKTFWLWPRLIRRKADIHPILFTLSFVACLKLAGLTGAILLSFPLASLLSVVSSSLKERHAGD